MTTGSNKSNSETVLVTGGSGYLALFCIVKLLKEGYKVRTTVRKLSRKEDVLTSIKYSGLSVSDDEIEFVEADLLSDNGWSDAVKGCKYILHVASPFPPVQPENEEDLIRPAVDGTLRVLKAARDDTNVKRVVLTSSTAAVAFGKPNENLGRPFTEEDWTFIDETCSAYGKSKTLAEKAAWNFIEKECDNKLELVTINPTYIFGPLLNTDVSTSIDIISSIIKGVQSYAQVSTGVVDVRDVADIHYLAMITEEAKGNRFISISSDSNVSREYIARLFIEKLPELSKTITPPGNHPDQYKHRQISNEKAKRILGWNPRPTNETLLSTAKSLADFNLI
ncbi:hypothetical protein DICPUDRAFT_159425 [Dictyostelium purpureum]|uniref:NAD-dependent epimerase/dehydratase domain-containing protein n=1 Tax=Dictyostelium purpureum TaxID=5786 RepID=F1A435_DICPU|nr:uncharacterized protein DICPUDRAFT_159425 [Dictyostelium purpureum]EGC29045.1 hypothetical protein DICPUDRAFT_159425 [Dictyostelium purpureum]|eukprot:XP_003294429.1 hypothetical protein DICPUDRAFT_159425 [Dictyostelium purpureum]